MRYQVPQFVDIEDKIIGPFTLKQFLIYFVAAMVLVPVYLFSDLSLFITIALPIVGIAAAFAHVNIHGKSLFQVVTGAIQFYLNGQLYLWRRTEQKPRPFVIKDEAWELDLEHARTGRLQDSISLAGIARALETQGNTVKTEEVADPFDQTI